MPNRFHELTEIELQTKLPDVKLAIDTKGEENDVLICPGNCADSIISFFLGHEIPYTQIDEPKLYPVEEIDKQLKKYVDPLYLTEDMDELKYLHGVTALITKFDADALFDWAMQLLSWDDKDPAYRAYRDKERQEAEEYYEKEDSTDTRYGDETDQIDQADQTAPGGLSIDAADADTITSMFKNWEDTKHNVYPCLLPQSSADCLAHDDFLDLAICYYIRTHRDDTEVLLWIPQKILDASSISNAELKAQALENLKNDGYDAHDMAEIPFFTVDPERSEEHKGTMFILTNRQGFLGSAGILLDDILEAFAEKIQKDFYILLSSIHGAILLPVSDNLNIEDINQLICGVDIAQLPPAERLSDHAYYYNATDHKIQIAR